MVLETGFPVAGSSIMTAIIAKFKCLFKQNGDSTFACGFTEKDLQEQGDYEIKEFQLTDNIRGIYVRPKHNIYTHEEHNIESDCE